MPASLPGSTLAQNQGNPSAGAFVIFCPLSGPKGSPLDQAGSDTPSTGALCTGIGNQSLPVIRPVAGEANAAAAIRRAGYDDDQTPGTERAGAGTKNTVNSTMMYIGGGKCNAASQGIAAPVPYTAGIEIQGAGNGASRDGGVGPTVFTGFAMKMVTATATVANGAVVETGWVNRSGESISSGDSVFGSAAAASATPA